jgi:hypothetical protein
MCVLLTDSRSILIFDGRKTIEPVRTHDHEIFYYVRPCHQRVSHELLNRLCIETFLETWRETGLSNTDDTFEACRGIWIGPERYVTGDAVRLIPQGKVCVRNFFKPTVVYLLNLFDARHRRQHYGPLSLLRNCCHPP